MVNVNEHDLIMKQSVEGEIERGVGEKKDGEEGGERT